ncbi:retrovirus-related pol polyprotein from transposon TNT 1-94 [Tanacetum coccineum]
MSQHLKSMGRSSSRPRNPRPSKHFFPPCIHYGFIDHLSDDCVNYPICDICGSYDHDTHGHNRIISIKREIKPGNPQCVMKCCETYGSTVHTTTDHNDIEWFRRGEELQAKKAEALKSTRDESLNANRLKTPTRSGCSRHMAGVKGYLHKYVEQLGPKDVFGDDSTCTTEGYGFIKCNGIVFTKVAFVNGLKYNLISISQLCDAKYIIQFDEKGGTIFNSNKEVVMTTLRVRDVYVLDMTSSAQESGFFAKASENLNWLWHKRLAYLNFKPINKLAKQNLVIGLPSLVYSKDKPCSSCEKGKHHRPVSKQNRHLLSRNVFIFFTWIYLDMNNILVNFCDKIGISQNFSSPYTPEQNGVAERKNRTLIEAARTMLSGSVFSKQYWTEAVATAFYIHNHKDHLGKFDEKVDERHSESSILEDNKLKKPITSYLMKVMMLLNSQDLQLTTSTLLKMNDIHLKNIFILMSLLKGTVSYTENQWFRYGSSSVSGSGSKCSSLNSNDVSFIEPYESPEPVVLETEASSDQNGQTDQNDQTT